MQAGGSGAGWGDVMVLYACGLVRRGKGGDESGGDVWNKKGLFFKLQMFQFKPNAGGMCVAVRWRSNVYSYGIQ